MAVTTIPRWFKILKYAADFGLPAAYAVYAHLFDQQDSEGDLLWHRVICTWQLSPGDVTPREQAQCSFDLLNLTGGDVDVTWTTADFVAAETALNTFWGAYMALVASDQTFTGYKWYSRRFNPATLPKPYANSGAPVRVTPRSVAGTKTGERIPHQSATTLTERTAFPKHWGRAYLPGLANGSLKADGRYDSARVDTVANAAGALYGALYDAQLIPVVPVVQVDKQPFRGLLSVADVQVDDVPDVVRRRRPAKTTYRAVRHP